MEFVEMEVSPSCAAGLRFVLSPCCLRQNGTEAEGEWECHLRGPARCQSKPRLPGRPGARSTHTISSRSADTGSLFPEVARGLWVLCGPVLEGPGFLHCTVEAETFCL